VNEAKLAEALRQLRQTWPFPDPSEADEHGLLAWGGDLSPQRLLSAYATGVFPWFDDEPILWFSPDPRWVLVPGELRVARSLRKTLRRAPFELRFDSAFEQVVRACAATPRPGQDGTWITADMIDAYCQLHELGFAHCSEAWLGDELVGGLYGVSLGSAFFGESMFAARDDASKAAFVALVRHFDAWGFEFIDCQVETDHLTRFGAGPWERAHFLVRLEAALEAPTRRGPWAFELDPSALAEPPKAIVRDASPASGATQGEDDG
jgi:leucyl/phenylalanyl-tRNA--protein transferase